MKVLTKSRYKLGLECPNKLFYTRKDEYADQKKADPFLKALAQGGFQVEELARLHYPGGHLLEGREGDYAYLVEWTASLMQQENVVIYEAAFLHEHLFIRTDILVKKGDLVELIEVKSKSFDPNDTELFLGKKGNINSSWKPYLFDIAFQQYVLEQCHPELKVESFLMMADKSRIASIDGLNQLFRISRDSHNRTGIVKKIDRIEEAGDPVLGRISISDIIRDIHSDLHCYHEGLGFKESIQLLREAYLEDRFLRWPPSFSVCKACEFKTTKEDPPEKRSGFQKCFTELLHWSDPDFEKPSTMEIWDFRRGGKLFDDGIYFMDQLTKDLVGVKAEPAYISRTERQWIQVECALSGQETAVIEAEGLREVMDSWTFPLHFIDFETSAVALPFHKGRRPYEQIAFQFSHHKAYANGKIEHATEFLNTAPGVFPNFDFIRALNVALEGDEGTIFRFATHENTILNAIKSQLESSTAPDRSELIEFIKHISKNKADSIDTWEGARNMIDLCQIVKSYYYAPSTKGSNSMKQLLPAMLSESTYLQKKYGKPIGELGLNSFNFSSDHRWLRIENGKVLDPYKNLAPLFENWSKPEMEDLLSGMEDISDGGAALTAYAKLQFTDMSQVERNELNQGLKKYCELDTLGMIMVWEGMQDMVW